MTRRELAGLLREIADAADEESGTVRQLQENIEELKLLIDGAATYIQTLSVGKPARDYAADLRKRARNI